MSQTRSSLILLSESSAQAQDLLDLALAELPEGEQLCLLPAGLEGPERVAALVFSGLNDAHRLQQIDAAVSSFRPQVIFADLAGMEIIGSSLSRHERLAEGVLLKSGTEKKRQIKILASKFQNWRELSL